MLLYIIQLSSQPHQFFLPKKKKKNEIKIFKLKKKISMNRIIHNTPNTNKTYEKVEGTYV